MKKIISIALAALFAASLSLSAQATENPFGMSDTVQDAQFAMSSKPDGKCGDGKCGANKKSGKCGGDKKMSGKCGGDKKKKDGKCGDGKCGGSK